MPKLGLSAISELNETIISNILTQNRFSTLDNSDSDAASILYQELKNPSFFCENIMTTPLDAIPGIWQDNLA